MALTKLERQEFVPKRVIFIVAPHHGRRMQNFDMLFQGLLVEIVGGHTVTTILLRQREMVMPVPPDPHNGSKVARQIVHVTAAIIQEYQKVT